MSKIPSTSLTLKGKLSLAELVTFKVCTCQFYSSKMIVTLDQVSFFPNFFLHVFQKFPHFILCGSDPGLGIKQSVVINY